MSALSPLRHLAASWLGLALVVAPAASFAQLPEYTFELRARTNLLGTASGSYAVAQGNLLGGSATPSLDDDSAVAFVLAITPEGRHGLWYGASGSLGSRIFLMPATAGDDARIGDVAIGPDGRLAFDVTGATKGNDNGIYLLDTAAPATPPAIVKVPAGATGWSGLRWTSTGKLGGRASVPNGRAYVVLTPANDTFTATWVAKEKGIDPASPYEFLYTPSITPSGDVVGVVDVAPAGSESFQELRVFGPNGSTLRAKTRGLESTSPIYRFASIAPAANAAGRIAFLGTWRSPTNTNVSTLWLDDGTQLRELAKDGVGDVRQLEFFPPAINAAGLVAFRAIGTDNLRGIWIADGEHTKRVVREHDLLVSDLGTARIDAETPSNPVFSGSVAINDRGDLAFVAKLTEPDNNQVSRGTAIWVARSTTPDAGTDGGTIGDAGKDADASVEPADVGDHDASPSGGEPDSEPPPSGGGGNDDSGAPLPDPGVDQGTADGDGCDCRMVGSKTPLSSLGLAIVAWLAWSSRRRRR